MVARGTRAALGRAVGGMSSAAADCASTQHAMMAAFLMDPLTVMAGSDFGRIRALLTSEKNGNGDEPRNSATLTSHFNVVTCKERESGRNQSRAATRAQGVW